MSSAKEFLIKQLRPIVLPHILPLEVKAIELLQSLELQENEKEVVSLLQVVNGEIYAFLFAVNENFDFVRQIEINEKKSFKIKDLLNNALNSI
jgi:hypothetical protein